MAILVYDYTDVTDFSYDTAKVELTSGQMRLKLQSAAGTFTEDFSDDTGFTYDNTKAEFSAGVLQSKDQLPANAICAATYTTDEDLSMATFTPVTGTLVGTPVFTSNVMTCTGLQGANYADSDIGNSSGVGAIKFKYTPNYTGAPPANINLVHLKNPSNNNDRVGLTQSPTGSTIRLWLYNASGTGIQVATAIGGNPGFVAGVEYEIELNWDSVGGVIRLFIDRSLHGTLSPGAWTSGTNATGLHVGGTTIVYSRAEADFSDVVLYDAVQHTSGYTSGYALEESRYVETEAILPAFTHTAVGTILTYTGLTLTTEVGSIRYQIKTDSGLYKYWSGSAWANTDGTYAQSNSSSDMDTNLPALTDADGAITVTIKMVLPSGETLSSLDNFVLDHTAHTGYPATDEVVEGTVAARTAGILSITATQVTPSGDSIGWFVLVSGAAFYWNGSAFATSNKTPAQTSSFALLQANITALSLDRQEFKLGYVLTSSAQTTTPYVDSTSITFTATLEDPTTPTLVFLEGFVYDHDGPVATTEILVRPYLAGHNSEGVFHKYEYQSFDSTNSVGYFNAFVYANKAGEQWEFKIGEQSYRVTVPDVSSVDWSTLNPIKVG